MSFEKAKADLEEKGLGDHVTVLNESSASTPRSSFWVLWASCPRHQRDAA